MFARKSEWVEKKKIDNAAIAAAATTTTINNDPFVNHLRGCGCHKYLEWICTKHKNERVCAVKWFCFVLWTAKSTITTTESTLDPWNAYTQHTNYFTLSKLNKLYESFYCRANMIELIGECFGMANKSKTGVQEKWNRTAKQRVQRTLSKRLHYIQPKRSYQFDGPFQFVFFLHAWKKIHTHTYTGQLKTLPFVVQLMCICFTILWTCIHSEPSILWQMICPIIKNWDSEWGKYFTTQTHTHIQREREMKWWILICIRIIE